MSEREEIYDREIAPELFKLGARCQELGMSFASFVEYQPGFNAETACVTKEATFAFRLILWAANCRGNIDSLMINVARWARQHGHSSMVLNLLKIPLVPDP